MNNKKIPNKPFDFKVLKKKNEQQGQNHHKNEQLILKSQEFYSQNFNLNEKNSLKNRIQKKEPKKPQKNIKQQYKDLQYSQSENYDQDVQSDSIQFYPLTSVQYQQLNKQQISLHAYYSQINPQKLINYPQPVPSNSYEAMNLTSQELQGKFYSPLIQYILKQRKLSTKDTIHGGNQAKSDNKSSNGNISGPTNRNPVYYKNKYPYNRIGFIYANHKTIDKKSMGVRITTNVILTVAHGLYFQNFNQQVLKQNILVYLPVFDKKTKKQSQLKLKVKDFKIYPEYYNKNFKEIQCGVLIKNRFDLALLVLEDHPSLEEIPPINIDWGYRYWNDYKNLVLSITHGVSSPEQNQIFQQKKQAISQQDTFLFYPNITKGGDSGTGIYGAHQSSQQSPLIALHRSKFVHSNQGILLSDIQNTKQMINRLIQQMGIQNQTSGIYTLSTKKLEEQYQRLSSQNLLLRQKYKQIRNNNLQKNQDIQRFKQILGMKFEQIRKHEFNALRYKQNEQCLSKQIRQLTIQKNQLLISINQQIQQSQKRQKQIKQLISTIHNLKYDNKKLTQNNKKNRKNLKNITQELADIKKHSKCQTNKINQFKVQYKNEMKKLQDFILQLLRKLDQKNKMIKQQTQKISIQQTQIKSLQNNKVNQIQLNKEKQKNARYQQTILQYKEEIKNSKNKLESTIKQVEQIKKAKFKLQNQFNLIKYKNSELQKKIKQYQNHHSQLHKKYEDLEEKNKQINKQYMNYLKEEVKELKLEKKTEKAQKYAMYNEFYQKESIPKNNEIYSQTTDYKRSNRSSSTQIVLNSNKVHPQIVIKQRSDVLKYQLDNSFGRYNRPNPPFNPSNRVSNLHQYYHYPNQQEQNESVPSSDKTQNKQTKRTATNFNQYPKNNVDLAKTVFINPKNGKEKWVQYE